MADQNTEEMLFAEGYRFDFYQAVKLLEGLHRELRLDAAPIGEDAEPDREAVRFKSNVDLAFPASDVAEITPPLLFQLGVDFQRDLERGTISEALRKELEDRGISLSEDARISAIVERGDCWKIADGDVVYFVEKQGLRLNFYVPPGRDRRPAEVLVNFMGLAGAEGPLPLADTELILERVWYSDTAFRDFLDIFNHRLVSLMYRVKKAHHIGLEFRSPDETRAADYLFSLIGLGTEGLRGRLHINDRALLLYTGLLAQKPRSAVGLQLLLKDYFKVPVEVHQFVGGWYPLEEDQLSFIGPVGQNQHLGMGAVLGTHVWDQGEKFELRLGPLILEEFLDFLPGGRGYRSLCELTRFYVDDAFDFEIELKLKAADVPESRLSADVDKGPKLGWTSWLKTQEFDADNASIRLSAR